MELKKTEEKRGEGEEERERVHQVRSPPCWEKGGPDF